MSTLDANHYLRSVQLLRDRVEDFNQYPFSLDVIRQLDSIELHPKVTFIIGENGTGKSTLLEAIAIAWGFNPEGGSMNFRFNTRSSHSDLYKYIRLSKSYRRPKDGYFLRAETFYNVASNIDQLDEEPGFGPPIKNSYGGKSLHKQSHGESFFSLITHRFSGHGLYILDEPEAALSPTRQMAMLSMMNRLIQKDSQFIISTHSPIILSYPKSLIYEIVGGELKITDYEKTEHYTITKHYLGNHKKLFDELTK